MKTQLTIETTPDQEMVIGLLQTGHLTRATREDVREFFGEGVTQLQGGLDEKAAAILEAAAGATVPGGAAAKAAAVGIEV